MAFAAGQRLTAGQLNRVQPITYDATGTTNLTLTATDQNIAGAAVTLTTQAANATYVVEGTYCFDVTSDTTDLGSGGLTIDGSAQSARARWSGAVATDFGPGAQTWRGTLATAGSHTFQLIASRGNSPSTGAIQLLAAYTRLVVTIYEVV